jgi:hypothetical protein
MSKENWCRRKKKRFISKMAKSLPVGSYALGCRSHPGVVTKRCWYPGQIYGADITIKSLIDGVEEGCDLYHCCPDGLFPEYAIWSSDPENHELVGLEANAASWDNLGTEDRIEYFDLYEKWLIKSKLKLSGKNLDLWQLFADHIHGKYLTYPDVYDKPRYR